MRNRPKNSPAPAPADVAPYPVIRYIGRSCFLIVAPDGTRIITDPYGYEIERLPFSTGVEADLITVSHGLDDDFQMHTDRGYPAIISEAASDKIGSVEITSYDSLRREWNGVLRGTNKIFVFQIGPTKIVHLGELGRIELPEVYKAIRNADVMLVPAGRVEAMSFGQLNALIAQTNARTVIPHHFGISGTERRPGMSTVNEYIAALPPDTVVIEAEELVVRPNMPRQVVILARKAFEDAQENLPIVERIFLDVVENNTALLAILCNGGIDHIFGSSNWAGGSCQSLWASFLRPDAGIWLGLWKRHPFPPDPQN